MGRTYRAKCNPLCINAVPCDYRLVPSATKKNAEKLETYVGDASGKKLETYVGDASGVIVQVAAPRKNFHSQANLCKSISRLEDARLAICF